MLIDTKEVEEMVKQIPSIAAKHPGVKLLVGFVGRVVKAVNELHKTVVSNGETVTKLQKTVEELEKRLPKE